MSHNSEKLINDETRKSNTRNLNIINTTIDSQNKNSNLNQEEAKNKKNIKDKCDENNDASTQFRHYRDAIYT